MKSKFKQLIMNLLIVLVILIFTFGFRWMATDAQNGESYEARGFLKQTLVYIIEKIGPTGIIIIGVLGSIYAVYQAIQRYNHPAKVFKYIKN